MADHLGHKIINLGVAKLSNSSAITCVPRLDLDHFASQYDSPRLNQRLPDKNHFREPARQKLLLPDDIFPAH
jgi:hypothetical protein